MQNQWHLLEYLNYNNIWQNGMLVHVAVNHLDWRATLYSSILLTVTTITYVYIKFLVTVMELLTQYRLRIQVVCFSQNRHIYNPSTTFVVAKLNMNTM